MPWEQWEPWSATALPLRSLGPCAVLVSSSEPVHTQSHSCFLSLLSVLDSSSKTQLANTARSKTLIKMETEKWPPLAQPWISLLLGTSCLVLSWASSFYCLDCPLTSHFLKSQHEFLYIQLSRTRYMWTECLLWESSINKICKK